MAEFRDQAFVKKLKYDPSRGLDKGLIATLATGEFINKDESVLITGATRCGKSFISSVLGHNAFAQGFKVVCFNVQKLLQQTKMVRFEDTIHQ
jgi:DNA replication protein DnaC